MADFITVAKADEIPAGQGRVVDAGGKQIALFNVGGNYHAIDGFCVHRGGPLGEGALDGNIVTCPWHGWTFDVTSGQCTFNPAAQVACYQVRVENGDVQVAV